MNQAILNHETNLISKTLITVLSIVALFLKVISDVAYFVINTVMAAGDYGFSLAETGSCFLMILDLAAYVLFLIYVLKLYQKPKAAIIVPVIFASMVVRQLINLISNLISNIKYSREMFTPVLTFVIGMAAPVTFTLALISSLKGLANKTFIIIPTIMSCATAPLVYISMLVNLSYYVESGMIFTFCMTIVSTLAWVILNVAFLVFGLKNRIPAIISAPVEEKIVVVEEGSIEMMESDS